MNRNPGGDPFQGGRAGFSSEATSSVLAVKGDVVRFAARLKPGSSAGGGVEIELRGSGDGMSWVPLAQLSATGREWATAECAVTPYAFLVLHTRLLGNGQPVGFDTRVTFDPK